MHATRALSTSKKKNFTPFQALEKVHETFESDMMAENTRVSQLEAIYQELNSLNYYNSAAVGERLQAIKDTFTNLQSLADNRRERIQAAIAAQQQLDAMRLDFAKKAAVCCCVFLQAWQ